MYQLDFLDLITQPCWLYSCKEQKLLWGNQSAFTYFNRSRDAFLNSSFGTSREQQATFKVFNSLVQDQVENGGSEQVISGFGHSILPGVIPHEQLSQCIFMYRQMAIALPDSPQRNLTLVQLLKSPQLSFQPENCSGVKLLCKESENGLSKQRAVLTGLTVVELCEAILTRQDVDIDIVEALHASALRGDILLQPTRIEEEIVSKEELDQDVGLNLLTLLGGKNLGGYVTGAALNRTPPAGGDDGTAGSLPGLQPPGTPVSTAASSLQPSSSSLLSSTQGRHSLCTSLSALSLEGDALEPAVYIASDTPPRFSSGSRLQGGAGSSEEDREAIAASIIPAMEAVLATVEEWRFDAFKLAEVTQGHPLSALSFWLFKRYNLIEQFQLDAVKLARFLRKVEDGYPNNPYHNKTHAADVLQGMHCLLTKGGLHRRLNEEVAMLASYLAAVLHDYEHKGLNNDFLVRAGDDLAFTYNDISPMENHHISAGFMLMRQRDFNFFKKMPRNKWVRFRRLLIDMVLGTDMKQHFNLLSKFQSKLQVKLRSTNIGAYSHSSSSTGSHLDSPTYDEPLPIGDDEADKSLVLQVGLKCADVGHLAAPWEVHHRWVSGLEEEFFRQGDKEKTIQLSVSPLMDRVKDGITKSQVGFFDIVALPLFYSWASVFHEAMPLVRAVEDNANRWRHIEQGQRSGSGSK